MTTRTQDLQAAMHLARAAAQLIETAANRTEGSEEAQDEIRGAAWRLADAEGILGEIAGSAEITGTGITDATGRGYTLPRKAPTHDLPRIKLQGKIGGVSVTTLAQIEAAFDKIKSGPDLIAALLDAGLWHQGDLAKASRLGAQAITDLKLGRRRPKNAERAALYWAIASRTIK